MLILYLILGRSIMIVVSLQKMNKSQAKIVIIGAGTAGLTLANKLAKKRYRPTVIDPRSEHYYQPGFLMAAFGEIDVDKLHKPLRGLLKKRVSLIAEKVVKINTFENKVELMNGEMIDYDVLVVATGTHIDPSMTEGLQGDKWYQNIFDFYTPDGATSLTDALKNFKSGKLVVQIMEMPIKCPVAPLEFSFLADDYFKKQGTRKDISITYVTPLSGAFTKPVASARLGGLLADKDINLVTDFYVEKVDSANNKIICYDERTVEYDLLVTVPVNVGVKFLRGTEYTNDLGFVTVNHGSLQSTKHSNIFAIGDATDVPTSKAGSVAHFETETVVENIENFLNKKQIVESFDGHSNCFVELGGGKALLLDFNYKTEPLEGLFPFPVIGPMKLLRASRINHFGKLAFRHIYWHMLLPGRNIPFIKSQMSIKGKKIPKEVK